MNCLKRSPKLTKKWRVAVFLPAYKRPEYTRLCIESLEKAQGYKDVTFFLLDDGSKDGTEQIFIEANLHHKIVITHPVNIGLRNSIIRFMKAIKDSNFDLICKIDNDCTVPINWLDDVLEIFEKSNIQLASPNVSPSNAAYKYGRKQEGNDWYMPAKTVGGLWIMYKSLIEGMYFEKHDILGIKGAYNILKQILIEKEPVTGWLSSVTFEDVGHWSGSHENHIKTVEHELYYREIGRAIQW